MKAANCPFCGQRVSPAATVCPSCGVALNNSTNGAALANLQALPIGTQLAGGKYSVGRVLGQGGFGITYLGAAPALGRSVAIKEFFPQGAVRQGESVVPSASIGMDNYLQSRQRFRQEADVLRKIHQERPNPGIVSVYDVLEENGTVYMVMQYIQGKPLDQILRERGGKLPEGEALAIIRAVGEALSAVHSHGILHRDLKPENIIVTSSGQPVLIDFGAAREFTPERTQALSVVLTPGYAPPEQYASAVRRGPYSDVYALAATLYHLVTGEMPASAIERAGGLDLKPPRELNPRISPTLEQALLRALAIKVGDRPQTVAEFLNDLEGRRPAPVPVPDVSVNGRANGAKAAAPPVAPVKSSTPSQPAARPAGQLVTQRLADLASQLTSGVEVETAVFRCPVCRQGALADPGEGKENLFPCPVCNQALVQSRVTDPYRCPSCAVGHLHSSSPPAGAFFCPICRLGLVHQEMRGRRWLFWPDWWLVCGNCGANWRKGLFSEDWLLMEGGPDPYHVLADNLGQAKPVSGWAAMAHRAPRQLTCANCEAVFDVLAGDSAERIQYLSPGRGNHLHPNWLHRALTLPEWAKLAAGLSLEDASHICPSCQATFDQSGDRFTLRAAPRDPKNLALRFRGKSLTRGEWRRVAAGKRSPEPGLLCPRCSAEFSRIASPPSQATGPAAPPSWRLDSIATYDPYGIGAKWLHRVLGEEDWRRLAAGRLLKADEERLRTQVRQMAYEALTAGEIAVDNLQREYPGPRLSGEQAILAFQANKLSRDGHRAEDTGRLWITNRRVYFRGQRGNTDVPLDRLNRVRVGGNTYIIFYRHDRVQPMPFTLTPTQMKVSVSNLVLSFSTDANTIERVIAVARGAK